MALFAYEVSQIVGKPKVWLCFYPNGKERIYLNPVGWRKNFFSELKRLMRIEWFLNGTIYKLSELFESRSLCGVKNICHKS